MSHAVENFRICAGEAEGEFDGSVFCDGDFYKWLEAAVYTAYTKEEQTNCSVSSLQACELRTDNVSEPGSRSAVLVQEAATGPEGIDRSKLREEIEGYISLIARAQQPDGYLSTKQILGERDGSAKRNSDINDFEVYNMGHLFTSACLHYRVSGRTEFLEVAKKAAGYLERLYEESEKSGEVRTAVCPSHYMGLLELYRTTGEERYLRLAKKAIELRDSVKDGLDDNQDRLPLKAHRKIIGHAVRANYLYAGLADLCAEIDDPEYEKVLRSVWHDLVTKKLYITGGCGALYNGASPYGNFFHHQLIHQAYGYEYQLPNITAYNETCASVGLVMWAYRMFQIDPRAEYFDILERAWLNVNLASVSLDGLRFFYENMLRREKKLDYELIWPLTRTDYLISYCCPPNIARQLSQSAEYAYETDREGNIWVGLYGENEAVIPDPLQKAKRGYWADADQKTVSGEGNEKAGDESIVIRQKTAYPYDGKIVFEIDSPREFFLYLRIPAWCRSGRLQREEGSNCPVSHSQTC
ncbi:MAG: glycoside hydrolase family 127 protein, partial [Lachnospiraceae bacterium]|nr:glycoside hydrolase family 127 protein [Lachnospiraceae bacterium]